MSEPSHVPMLNALTAISTFVIGYSVWGNEADYWRFAKTGVTRALAPLAVALLIGEVLFPTAGWLVARTTGVVDAAAATAFMNNYSFAGLAVVALTILTASYFAVNDSGMFGSSTALESLWPIKHRVSVTIVATAGAIAAAFLSLHDSTKALEVIASLNCIFAPTPTVIVLTEWFLRAKIFHSMEDMSYVPSFNQLPRIIWPAALAFLLGITAGVATSGLIPALEFIHAGIPPVFAWITAATVYSCLRIFQHRREMADQKIILESSLARTRQSESLIGSKGKR